MSHPSEHEAKPAVDSASQSATDAEYDPATLARVLASPPFVAVEGVINFRDVGGVRVRVRVPVRVSPTDGSPVPDPSEARYRLKPGILFRSGELTRLTPRGRATLRDELRITTIFDLRSKVEVERWNAGTPGVGVGVGDETDIDIVRAPVADEGSDEFNPAVMAQRVQRFEADEQEAFATLYSDILTKGSSSFETILKHLRDKPDEPCLVHCTAGKDRTGILAALVLLLLRAPDDAIVHDYALTTAGLRPAMPFLVARFKKEPAFAGNWKGVENMGSARAETMRATLHMIRQKYGGAEAYVKRYTSLTDEDIEVIRRNLIVQE